MSFGTQLSAAIAAARTNSQLDTISREVSVAWGGKVIDDDTAGAALEALAGRRQALSGNHSPPPRKPLAAPRRPPRPRSPDRQASLRRRRREIAPSSLPPALAEQCTPGQIAALSVIARDIAINGQCSMCVDRLAAVAGVCARVVQQAQRIAERLGYLSIEERRRPGKKSLSNVLRPNAEWGSWLGLHRVNRSASHGKRMNNSLLTQRHDPASWRFDPGVPRFFGSAKGWGGESPPSRPAPRGPIEPHPQLAAALARAEALLAG